MLQDADIAAGGVDQRHGGIRTDQRNTTIGQQGAAKEGVFTRRNQAPKTQLQRLDIIRAWRDERIKSGRITSLQTVCIIDHINAATLPEHHRTVGRCRHDAEIGTRVSRCRQLPGQAAVARYAEQAALAADDQASLTQIGDGIQMQTGQRQRVLHRQPRLATVLGRQHETERTNGIASLRRHKGGVVECVRALIGNGLVLQRPMLALIKTEQNHAVMANGKQAAIGQRNHAIEHGPRRHRLL